VSGIHRSLIKEPAMMLLASLGLAAQPQEGDAAANSAHTARTARRFGGFFVRDRQTA